ncbi:MAG: hypothetical protein AAFZ65_03820, partial [Planctomycetota bacterium]
MKSLPFAAAAALAFAGTASAQTLTTMATESFDYAIDATIDGNNGGFGWFQQYFGDAGTVVSPGLDAVGGALDTSVNNSGTFRQPKTGPWINTVAQGFNFGGNDGTGTIWFSFTGQRTPGSDSQYAGISFHTSFVGEKLYIGSPFASNEWGVAVPGVGDFRVAGSSVDVATRVVCRVDYQTGDERFRMWLDPATANPTSAADIDVLVASHDWNEFRFQAGEGPTQNGWLWDDIVLECQDCLGDGLLTDTTSISTFFGGTANLDIFGGLENEGDFYVVAGSFAGTAPGTPFGTIGIVPLNFDAYTNLTLANAAAGGLTNAFGNLDLDGRGFVDLTIPANQTNLAGLNASYAAVIIDS